MGDLDGAEEAFTEAHQCGNDAQPGLALLQLARGRSVAARSSIRATLDDQPSPLVRARLLPAHVEIALASHDVAEARDAAEELQQIASTYEAPLWHANAHQALGLVLTYEGDAPGAIAELRKALRHWGDADLPFEAAQARRCLAMAHRANGDEASAVMELRAAHSTFERLGAKLEAARCLEVIDADAQKAGRRVARTFMFTDIVGSTNLLETIGDDAWEGVVRWHDETLRRPSSRTAVRSSTRPETGSSRRSRTRPLPHRVPSRSSGCWPSTDVFTDSRRRFGSDCTRQKRRSWPTTDAGMGVHQAARVGAVAEGDEIVVTCGTIEAEPIPFAVSGERAVSLKGISRPVRVVSIDWRT